ncbi:hypothetical protein PAXRUDRAFT_826919 [Paxillus rubicundulus Ve08.2h10]|uniref:Uncharacterized protein n=1 Tax=Paxillus rubicundulus Ve08.2h10 TaxID=930991 RepID=A0A0D0DDV2_9AGAM|nr:hypothetical protein PAXRUDRAFT_826919 [Paxillus rubicundulus Ve08.2h10]
MPTHTLRVLHQHPKRLTRTPNGMPTSDVVPATTSRTHEHSTHCVHNAPACQTVYQQAA